MQGSNKSKVPTSLTIDSMQPEKNMNPTISPHLQSGSNIGFAITPSNFFYQLGGPPSITQTGGNVGRTPNNIMQPKPIG